MEIKNIGQESGMNSWNREKWRAIYGSSHLFRRGNAVTASKEFGDVVDELEHVSTYRGRVSVLVLGVAQGEEPLSLLIALRSFARQKRKSLDEFVDLNTVDMRPKLEAAEVANKSYEHVLYDIRSVWRIWQGLENVDPQTEPGNYKQLPVVQVKSDVVEYFNRVIEDPSKAIWNTRLKEYLSTSAKKSYDVISYNNTDFHIEDEEERKFIMGELLARLNWGGILITDPGYGGEQTLKEAMDYNLLKEQYGLEEIKPGIFQRTK